MDVNFVLMPYGPLLRPSLGLGLLKARLAADAIDASVFYANLHFAEEIGLENYRFFHEQTVTEDLLGEWTFSAAAFPEHEVHEDTYFGKLKLPYPRALVDSVRAKAPAFVRRMAEQVVETGAKVVGCSSTFQQHCASLALLREIRELDPEVITLIGGANCEGAMGRIIAERFPWVDYIVSGEADELIAGLCRDLLAEGRYRDAARLPYGVFASDEHGLDSVLETAGPVPRASVTKLDAIAIPDFREYFDALAASPLERNIRPGGLPIETSRGCWWGAKHHCTFCGLNGSGMAYRSKSSERVLHEIDTLQARHGSDGLEIVDNILDMKYFDTVLPRLAEHDPPLRVFYETKSNLKRRHIRELARAGVRWIQPGIESMHDDALRLLDKGNSAWSNVLLLKWALEQGVHVTWQILAGIPGEEDSWYTDVAEWLPLVYHLQAPGSGLDGIVPIRFDRFSPYHETPERFGLSLKAYKTYASVYPLDDASLDELAYFFEDSTFDRGPFSTMVARPGLAALSRAIVEWQKSFYLATAAKFIMTDDGTAITFEDTRACAPSSTSCISGLARDVYLTCDEAPARSRLARLFPATDAGALDEIVDDLIDRKLVVKLGDRLVSLATAPSERPLPGPTEFPGGHYMLRKSASKQGSEITAHEMLC